MNRKTVGIIFACVGMVFACFGALMVWAQHHRMTTFVPVEATVVSSTVEEHTSTDSDGHRHTTYKPVIRYCYEVRGVAYADGGTLPLSVSAGPDWARSIVSMYPPGKITTAWYDQRRPGEAFIVRECMFFPYIFVIAPMAFVALGIAVAVAAGASATCPPAPVAAMDGRFELRPGLSIAARTRACAIASALWHGAGLLACGHFFLHASRPYAADAIIWSGVYEGIGIIPAGMMIYFALLGRKTRDARVFLSRSGLWPGVSFTATVQQDLLGPVLVEEIRIGLVCMRTAKTSSGGQTSISTTTASEDYHAGLQNHAGREGDKLQMAWDSAVPEDAPPSSPAGQKAYPRYAWHIAVHTKLVHSPDYRARFPVTVLPTGSRPDSPENAGWFRGRMKRMLGR